MFFYLLTGQVPSEAQVQELVKDMATRSVLSPYVEKIIDAFRKWSIALTSFVPFQDDSLTAKEVHPMTQFVAAVASLEVSLDLIFDLFPFSN